MRNVNLKSVNNKLVNEAKELSNNRGNVNDFLNNFLLNVSRRARYVRFILNSYRDKNLDEKEILQTSASLYICSLITCWETFFRDLIVFICNNDQSIKEEFINLINNNDKVKRKILLSNLEVEEYLSKIYNLQNLDSLCSALSFVLRLDSEHIADFIEISLKNESISFYRSNYFIYFINKLNKGENIKYELRKLLDKCFDIRHKVTHDANYKFEIDSKFMTELEDCFVVIPQLISIFVCRKYNNEYFVANNKQVYVRLTKRLEKDEVPYIFSIADLVANDYQVVETN